MSKSFITHTEALSKKGLTTGGSNDYSTKSWLESNGFTVQSSLGRAYKETEFVVDDDIIASVNGEVKIKHPNTYGCFNTMTADVANSIIKVELYNSANSLLQTWTTFNEGDFYYWEGDETDEVYTLKFTFNQNGTSVQELFLGMYIDSISSSFFQTLSKLQNASYVFQGVTFNSQIPDYLFQYNPTLTTIEGAFQDVSFSKNEDRKIPLLFNNTYPNLTNASKLFQVTGSGTGFNTFGVQDMSKITDSTFTTTDQSQWVDYSQYNTEFNLFKGCPNITNVSNAFEGNDFEVLPCGIFEGITESTSINYTECFKDCISLRLVQPSDFKFYSPGSPTQVSNVAVIPTNNGSGREYNITSMFDGCSNLLGLTTTYWINPTGAGGGGGIIQYTYDSSSYHKGTGSPMFGLGVNAPNFFILSIDDIVDNTLIADHCFRGCTKLLDYSTINNTYK